MPLYIDDPYALDWDKPELLDRLSIYDEDWKITSRECSDGKCYDLEAVGSYSC